MALNASPSKDFGLDSISQLEPLRVFEQKGCELSNALQKLNQAGICAMNLIGGGGGFRIEIMRR